MGSLLVVVIVGGALVAITTSALDAAQPATARPGTRSAAELARSAAGRARGAMEWLLEGVTWTRGKAHELRSSAASAPISAFRRVLPVPIEAPPPPDPAPLPPAEELSVAAPTRQAPPSEPVGSEAPVAVLTAVEPHLDWLDVSDDDLEDDVLFDDLRGPGYGDGDGQVGLWSRLRALVWYAFLVTVLGAATALVVVAGVLVAVTALRSALG